MIMENVSKRLLLECELRGQIQRVWRHLPGGEKQSKATHYGVQPVLSIEEGRKHIIKAVQSGEPYMVARFGTSEGNCLYEYWKMKLFDSKRGEYSDRCVREMCVNAGFFPESKTKLDQWAETETKACEDLDMLGSMNFLGEEWIYRTFCSQSLLMPSGGIASAAKGWTWCL